MTQLPIDLDCEAIFFDGQWYTRDDLARHIRAMLDSGDFAVSRPSQALEMLNATLASLRTLAFRATPELADALNALAARQGRTVGGVIRETLVSMLQLKPREASARDALPPGRRPTDPELPAVQLPAAPGPEPEPAPALAQAPAPIQAQATASESGDPAVLAPAAVVTEAASLEEAASAVNLTSKKSSEEEAIERRWFGG